MGRRRRVAPAVSALLAVLAAPLLQAGGGVLGVVSRANRPLKDVVVWLRVPGAARADVPRKIVLDQRNMQFAPHVLAVPVGTIVEMPNSDRVFHNVFSFHDGKVFDLGVYPVGASKKVLFDRPGLSRIFCNIHPNMAAYVMAVDSKFVAVSDGDGRFAMPAIADGRYAYSAWRSGAETVTGSIEIRAGEPLAVRLP